MTIGNQAGTVETIAIQVATLLGPLHRRLADGAALELLAELGLRFPPALAADSGFAAAITDCTATGRDLANAVRRLVAASEAEDLPEVALASAAVVNLIAGMRTALGRLATALRTAAGTLGFPAGELDAFVADLPRRLIDHSIVTHLEAGQPLLVSLLDLAGVVERVEENIGSTDPVRPEFTRVRLHVDRLARLLFSPAELAGDLYGWGTPEFDGVRLFARVATVLSRLGLPAVHDTGALPVLDVVVAEARVVPGPPEPGLAVMPRATVAEQYSQDNDDGLTASATLRLHGPKGAELVFTPDGAVRFAAPAQDVTEGQLTLRVDFQLPAGGEPVLLFGQQSGPRLLVRRAWLELGGALTWDAATGAATGRPSFAAAVADGEVALHPPVGDGFLGTVVPAGSRVPFTAELGLRRTGLHLRGSAGLEMSLPVRRRLGPVSLEQIHLAARLADSGIDALVTTSLAFAAGPVHISIGGLGVEAQLRPAPDGGNAGPVQVQAGIAAPTRLGIAVDATAVTGGGFLDLDPRTGRYGGALQLVLAEVRVEATGLLETRVGGGYSLIVAIRAEFPPVQVGLGFALTGAGGLIALNRRVDVDGLRYRIASGTAGRILNPADPIGNAPALLADLGTVFPAQPGVHVVGPTVQLVWAGLVQFDVGVFFELPGPTRIVILGSARAEIARGTRKYLAIRIDIVGEIDLQKRNAAFDAVLVNSRLLDVFDLTGGAAFRLSWGAQPYVVLTVGGFRPGYNPEPLVFPKSLTRITMVRGRPTDTLYLRLEGYFAVTSNTLQFGAAAEAIINAGDFNIRGTIDFHALIQFQPFHFQADIRASVHVRYKSHNIAGLTLTGSLSGPGPVTLHAKVCIELLFFDICFEDTYHLGAAEPPPLTTIAGALQELTAELDTPANLHASETTDRYVAVRPPGPEVTRTVVSPLGHLAWTQRRAPLGLLLQRIGGTPLAAPRSVQVSSPQLAGTELDWFAPGSFADLSDAEALNRKGFERLTGGVRFGADGTDDGPDSTVAVTVQQIRIPVAVGSRDLHPAAFPAWFTDAVQARAGGATTRPAAPSLQVTEETWSLIDRTGAVTESGLSQAQAHQLAAVRTAAVAVARPDLLAEFTF